MADSNSTQKISKERTTTFKIVVSIIFGLLSFAVNFHTINFAFPPYTATVLIGLLFPMLITLTWGWKFGLISALCGGCQSMWWLWGPSNGYAIFSIVPPFTIWIVWHGLIADLRIKRKDRKWWLSRYAVEVPFRILSTINLYTLSRWAITLNPPPWNWASGASSTVPMHFSNFVVVKQAVVGYIILLLADVLLSFKSIRSFFRLKADYNQANTNYIISASLLLGILFWVIDSVIDYMVFYAGSSFLDLIALDIPPNKIFIRTFFFLACLAGGLIASKLLRRQRLSDIALQESEKTLSQIVIGSAIPIFVIDEKHTVTHWNRACESLTGVAAEEIVGTKRQWAAFYSVERPVMADFILDSFSREEISGYYGGKCRESNLIEGAYEVENFFPGIGESGKWLFFTAAPLRDRKGKITGSIETLCDITDRVMAEKALRETKEQYRSLAEQAGQIMYDYDISTGQISWSGDVQVITGCTHDEFLQVDIAAWEELIHPDDREAALASLQKAMGTCSQYRTEYRFRRKNSMYLDIEDNGLFLTDEAGNVRRMLGIMKDITARKQAQQALEAHSEWLEEMVEERTKELRDAQEQLVRREKLALLGQLAGGVGHELRNPLGVIANAVYYLEAILPDTDKVVKEYLELISSEVSNSNKIIADLLDMTRTLPAERREIEVSDLIEQALVKNPPPEQVKVNLKVSSDLPPVFVDSLQIGQVLVNLITNAYQAMPEGGELIIKTQNGEGEAHLSIIDSGCGISEEDMAKIFEPLFTTKMRGIGLGLAVSKNLVELNGGSIEMESNSGNGSTFTVRLPMSEIVSSDQ